MTETKPEITGYSKNERLSIHLADVLTDRRFAAFFKLEPERIADWLYHMAISDEEIRFSPGYASAGWGHNQSKFPQIEASDLSSDFNNYEHEARHGLHNLKCQTLFDGPHWAKYVVKFRNAVLKDEKFIEQIKKPGGSPLQERMIKKVEELVNQKVLTRKDILENSWMFGALTYQHAYFVDPGMCEAVASFGDKGITFAVGAYNRWFATLFLPGIQFFEGYTNPDWQKKFEKANDEHKALLIKSTEYNRDEYWK